MVEVSWRQLGDVDPSTLTNDPSLYIRALFLKKDWSHLLQVTFDPIFADEVLSSLKVPSVRKQIFRESTADTILRFLDQVNEIFRKQILTILIESFEKLPVALAVGESLLQNLNDHPWAQTFSKYVISLQSDTFLKSYLKDESDKYSGYLLPENVVPLRLLSKRKRLGGVVVDVYIEA
jgi:hypothetical protein